MRRRRGRGSGGINRGRCRSQERLDVLEGNIEPIGCLTVMAAGSCDILSVQIHGDAVVRTVEERGTKKPEGVACEVNIHVPNGNVGLTVEQTATKKARVPGKDLCTRPVQLRWAKGRF